MGTFGTLAIGFILVTLCGTIILLRQVKEGRARFLLAMVGLVSMFHGLRLLTDSGVAELRAVAGYEEIVDLLVTVLTFAALLIVYNEITRHRVTRVRLRLSQAMEAPTPAVNERVASQVFDGRKPTPAGETDEQAQQVALARMVQASDIPIVTFDAAGRVTSCNEAAEALYGADEGELLGKPLPSLRSRRRKASPRNPKDRPLNPAEAHS